MNNLVAELNLIYMQECIFLIKENLLSLIIIDVRETDIQWKINKRN